METELNPQPIIAPEQQPQNTTPEANVEITQTPVLLVNKIKDAAIIAFLENYGKYLLKKGIVDSRDGVREKVGAVCSPALERGIITQATIDHVFGNIEKQSVLVESVKSQKFKCKFLKHALVEEMGEVLDGSIPAEAQAEFQNAIQLCNQYHAAVDQLVSKYGNIAQEAVCSFYNEFKNLFDASFAECVDTMCK